jgi:hypothetical protein
MGNFETGISLSFFFNDVIKLSRTNLFPTSSVAVLSAASVQGQKVITMEILMKARLLKTGFTNIVSVQLAYSLKVFKISPQFCKSPTAVGTSRSRWHIPPTLAHPAHFRTSRPRWHIPPTSAHSAHIGTSRPR